MCVCVYISPPSWPPPIPSIQVTTEHPAELPAVYNRFPLAICFTHGSVYMSIRVSQFVLPPPSTHLLLMSMCLSFLKIGPHFRVYNLLVNSQTQQIQHIHNVEQTLPQSNSNTLSSALKKTLQPLRNQSPFSPTSQHLMLSVSVLYKRNGIIYNLLYLGCFGSVQFSRSVVSDCL